MCGRFTLRTSPHALAAAFATSELRALLFAGNGFYECRIIGLHHMR